MIGHNGGPAIAPFSKKRWAMTLFTAPDKPPGAVAMAFKLYMEMDASGSGATISNAEFMLASGLPDSSCRKFKGWLVEHGFIQVTVRGRRGGRSEFKATIPEERIALSGSAIPPPEYQRPIALLEPEIALSQSAIPDLARPENYYARGDSNINNNNKNNLLQQPPEHDAARVAAADYLDGLNGTTIDLVAFIGKHAVVEEKVARTMLANNLKIYGSDNVLQAYALTIAEMATGTVAKPYKYLIQVAGKIKTDNAREPRGKNDKNLLAAMLKGVEQSEAETRAKRGRQ